MSTCTIRSLFHVEDPSAAHTVPKTTRHLRAVEPNDVLPRNDVTDRATSESAPSARILRRWSVAELIAAATWPQEAA